MRHKRYHMSNTLSVVGSAQEAGSSQGVRLGSHLVYAVEKEFPLEVLHGDDTAHDSCSRPQPHTSFASLCCIYMPGYMS